MRKSPLKIHQIIKTGFTRHINISKSAWKDADLVNVISFNIQSQDLSTLGDQK